MSHISSYLISVRFIDEMSDIVEKSTPYCDNKGKKKIEKKKSFRMMLLSETLRFFSILMIK